MSQILRSIQHGIGHVAVSSQMIDTLNLHASK